MQAGCRTVVIGAVLSLPYLLLSAPAALAQLVQSEVESEQSATETTTQLVTSSTEVRRAVIGLIVVGLVVAILGVLYWRKTGQQARDRHASRFGGKHQGQVGAQRPSQPPTAAQSGGAALAVAAAQAPSAQPGYGADVSAEPISESSRFLGGGYSSAAGTPPQPTQGQSLASSPTPSLRAAADRPVFNPTAPVSSSPAQAGSPSQASVFDLEPQAKRSQPTPTNPQVRQEPRNVQPERVEPPSQPQGSDQPTQHPHDPGHRNPQDGEEPERGWRSFRRDLFG